MKVQKSANEYTEAALDEIDLLCKIKSMNEIRVSEGHEEARVVLLKDHFYHVGPHGKRMFYFKLYVDLNIHLQLYLMLSKI